MPRGSLLTIREQPRPTLSPEETSFVKALIEKFVHDFGPATLPEVRDTFAIAREIASLRSAFVNFSVDGDRTSFRIGREYKSLKVETTGVPIRMWDKPLGADYVACLTAKDYHDPTFQRAAPRKIPHYDLGPASSSVNSNDWDNFLTSDGDQWDMVKPESRKAPALWTVKLGAASLAKRPPPVHVPESFSVEFITPFTVQARPSSSS